MNALTDIYELIGQIAADTVPEDWLELRIVCEAGDSWVDLSFSYRAATDTRSKYLDLFELDAVRDALNGHFSQLLSVHAAMDGGAFEMAIFSMNADGEFTMDYSYEPR